LCQEQRYQPSLFCMGCMYCKWGFFLLSSS
jgi:hypothetical protein